MLTNAKAVILLKHLSNFWRKSNILLINCEVELVLIWSKKCVLADMTENVTPSGAKLKITDTKLYIQVITLSKENGTKLLEQLKARFKKNYKMEQIQVTNDYSASK